MGLNKSKGNMYPWITHTWNTVKGACYHDCSYCYMKQWGGLKPVRFDEKELKTDLGKGNFIFVGSSCDMWAQDIPDEWILKTLRKCYDYNTYQYLFQSKNPKRILDFNHHVFRQSVVCTTLETNRWYPEVMNRSPEPYSRVLAMDKIADHVRTYVTVEPILDFDLNEFIHYLQMCRPSQINLGADSGNNNLPEPPKEKILELISELEKFTKVKQKSNLKRLLK